MHEITTQSLGTHPNGKEIFLFTLQNEQGTIVNITNYGAIITAIKIRKSDGTLNDIVLGFDHPMDYLSEAYLKNYPYYGAAIGRYGNRIKDASIHIDGQQYILQGQHASYQLHGGIEGFDKKVWEVINASPHQLVLQYISPDGEEGFPGTLTVQIIFTLTHDNELSYEYKAETDKATAVNLTHHTYFNLNDGVGTIDTHHLKINAAHYLEQDDNYCTTGKVLPVKGTRNDFSQYRQTGTIDNPEKGIDISYPLDYTGIDQVAAEAYCDEQDIKLQVYTTEPLVHLYNAYASPTLTGKGGKPYSAFSAFCFETQVHPNAINIPTFPNTILRPGETYYTKTIYKFTTKDCA